MEESLYTYIKRPGSLITRYSPRFENICKNLALYEGLYSSYYDFHTQEKLLYNVRGLQECIVYVYCHSKDCNARVEIRKILSSGYAKAWLSALDPPDRDTAILKDIVLHERYWSVYPYTYYLGYRFGNLRRKAKLALDRMLSAISG